MDFGIRQVRRVIGLFAHNQAAYDAVLEQLRLSGKAAVIHPTGTGKSFIAFKLAEDNPRARFCWLSPSEHIFRTQLENVRKVTDYPADNISFMTYAKLMNLSEEEISAFAPDYIVLDEFHRAGASEWGRGVDTLLSLFPGAKLLGLSATHIRYLDHQRNMADELFDNCIADQMSLAEAVTRGILPAPKYVVSFYAYQLEEQKYRDRMRRVSLPVRRQAEEYLEKLRRAIEKAEGLEDIFPKHMDDPHGKYIVFCASQEHMREMLRKSPAWFKKVDPDFHAYTVWAESASAKKDYEAFKEDNSDHLKLLYCIDMFNEGIHVEDISGVILFRPTVSPIIYKQQIGRALSAMRTDTAPVIFDIVNNFENLYTISSLREEAAQFSTFQSNLPRDNSESVNPFRIIDEVRECRELFARLEDTLGLSWEMMYREAKKYYAQNGHLNVPKTYKTEDDIPLGVWIMTQRRIRLGTAAGLLSEYRIQRLDEIGMVWKPRQETAWETGLRHAKEYREEYGNLDVKARYVSPDGYRLGSWIANARQKYQKILESGKDPLANSALQSLEDLGIQWEKGSAAFEAGLKAAEAYQKNHGTLEVPLNYVTKDGFKLGRWLDSQRTRKKRNAQGAEAELAKLEELGMVWTTRADSAWEKNYQKAKAYFEANGSLNLPPNYCAERTNLWKWVCHQRDAYKAGRLDPERIRKLEAIGMQWTGRGKEWGKYLEYAAAYKARFGNLEIPPAYITPEGVWLGRWLAAQRTAKSRNELSAEQIRQLDTLGIRWTSKVEDHWDEMFRSLTEWLEKQSQRCAMPRDTKASDGSNLFLWTRRQRTKRIQGKLSPCQQQKWDGIQSRIAAALNLPLQRRNESA